MLTQIDAKVKGLADLPPVQSDSLIALIGMVNADPRPDKIMFVTTRALPMNNNVPQIASCVFMGCEAHG